MLLSFLKPVLKKKLKCLPDPSFPFSNNKLVKNIVPILLFLVAYFLINLLCGLPPPFHQNSFYKVPSSLHVTKCNYIFYDLSFNFTWFFSSILQCGTLFPSWDTFFYWCVILYSPSFSPIFVHSFLVSFSCPFSSIQEVMDRCPLGQVQASFRSHFSPKATSWF